jgi:tetratricopeptide (TPR) repeat protein
MAQPASNPKIEELRFRLKTDPKSRIFFPLAEELRKAGQTDEAEQVLRTGLSAHPTYLSAWVSLGRVLREQKKDGDAVEPLLKALQLDPGNVVAARILADAYLALGEKLEAIKKYKLVQALIPSDQELSAVVHQLERELHPPEPVALEPEPEPVAAEPEPEPEPVAEAEPELPATADPFASDTFALDDDAAEQRGAETDALAALIQEQRMEMETGDVEPMRMAHDASPFEEPVGSYTADAVGIEGLSGFHVERAPLAAEVPALVEEELSPSVESATLSPEPVLAFTPDIPIGDEADIFAPAEDALPPQTATMAEPETAPEPEPFVPDPFAADPFDAEPPPPEAGEEDLTNTLTMADLYARQGALTEARHIYENILARDPENHAVREKLDAILAPPEPDPTGGRVAKIARLENWLARVSRKEDARV